MTKVVYNACYGGFSLSKEACQRYWEIKGQEVWIEYDDKFKSFGLFTVWLVPPTERVNKSDEEFQSMTMNERIAYNKAYSEQTWQDRYVDRHDPILVQVVEELGEEANGPHANLQIAEVDGPYRIDEYDGYESVETPDSYDWITP
jgi:hypothetical protein